ncbi:N-isopropylammelide isopropyl amidohydrolase [Mannheimia haemolytica]|uniref:N-isopropylammelide isopropyl amidohydrolase n=1 Tax=Mannheimia haemolytica TaxID=75985 RepID=A0A448TE05_MANHA|nr:amidohydrolase family protein [Mannheimia haemolytica]UQX68199.1 amidohydrolase family protein [Mannheimia haemolytica]STY63532.1 N-isopropylammelide isopropyl amidohydrolase [Mannheimia haemolytica]VEI78240.1 N-isopropylammelide isopropyl amidohydrolase [Mannheimia haemolytica]HDL5698409.1 amidohydrolase family protein [Mannheimia haemolytica]HDV7283816.1 amidohydrolase family protein [Mannheimia haemolytica]
MSQLIRTLKGHIRDEIIKQGGWVNAHAHADRAFTMTPEKITVYQNANLQQKWDLVDEVKRNSTVEDYYRRFSQAIELMISQGVTAFGTFVDIDQVCEDRAIIAAHKAREVYKNDIILKFANQTLKGVIEPNAKKWFDIGSEMVDMIGGLPYRDELDYGKGLEAMDILMDKAKSLGKMLHVHVDQFNSPKEKETEQLCDKSIEHGMQGRVVAIHGISIGSHPKEYRKMLYQKMRDSQMMVIACPMAWIDSGRKEDLQPFHNALTPADELIPEGITVAIGTDNICDYMVPLCEGDMWQELSLLSAGCRFTNLEEMANIASINGRKVLGLV